MLLRRITEHVKAQNWTAVALDFVIVVVGVFMGIQVANWNEVRSNKVGLVGSLERLNNEVGLNLEIGNKILEEFEESHDDLEFARNALSRCKASPEATAALERTLSHLKEDVQPNFVAVALDQLARQDQYLDILSDDFQKDLGLYTRRLKEEHEQLTSHYQNAWYEHITYHPSVTANFAGDYKTDWGFALDKPFEEVCQDATFRNRFINTIGFTIWIGIRLERLNSDIEMFQTALAKELEDLN